MTDGLDAVREVATHWRRRYQAAQALLAETQRENRYLEYGLIDAHRKRREIEQNATSTLEELVGSLDSMEKERDTAKDALFMVTSIKNRALDERDSFKFQRDELDKLFYRAVGQRDDFKVRLEGSRNMVDHVVAERNQARRRIAELEATVANLDPRIARLERITGGDPIQGVEDMWWIGCESWQTEDE